jgi:branched-chain amino acid transport system substrate-binding protein
MAGRIWAAAAMLALAAGSARADIKIAVAGPMTGSNAAFGDQFRRGAVQAVADINAAGGVLGQQLVLEVGDDACDPKQAVTVANQLASDGVVFVAGHFCSGSSIPASSVYNENNILEITPGSTNPALTDDAFADHWTNVYRTCGRDDEQGRVAAKYLADHFKDKIFAIIDDRSAYGKGLADETRSAAKAAGLTEAIDESIAAGDHDFSALISKLKQANVQLIYFGGYQTEAGLILRQAREQGLQALLMSGDAMATEDFWQITGSAGEGSLFTFPPDPEKKPGAKAVVDAFRKAGYDPEGYTLYSYAAIQIFAAAAAQANSTKLDDLVKALHAKSFDTVIGPITYDQKGDITQAGYVVWKWHDGRFSEF